MYESAFLCSPRTASAEQVRHAYRKKALHVHPDKLPHRLGRPPLKEEVLLAEKQYRNIVVAFDVLSDSESRKHYDDTCGRVAAESLQADSGGGAFDTGVHAKAEARLLLQSILSGNSCPSVAILKTFRTDILVSLRDLLRGSPARNRPPTGQGGLGTGAGRRAHTKVDPCIHLHRQGYVVQVTWSMFTVCTNKTPSLEQALAWRVACTLMRNQAKSRMRQGDAKTPQQEMLRIFEEAISEALRMEPDMRLSFRFQFRFRKMYATPNSANLRLALSHSVSFRTALETNGNLKGLELLRANAKLQVSQDKRQSSQRCDQCLLDLVQELDQRLLQVSQIQLQVLAATELQRLLGLNSSEATANAVMKLRQLPEHELRHRSNTLLAPMQASPALPSIPKPMRVKQRPLQRQEGLCLQGQGFLTKDVVARMLDFIYCIDIDSFRAASTFALGVGEDQYWQRCRTFSCPSHILIEDKRSSSGRALRPTGHSALINLTIDFIAQPRLSSYFEHLKFQSSIGGAMITNHVKLTHALSQMPHISNVQVYDRGWNNSHSRRLFLKSLSERGISCSLVGRNSSCWQRAH